MPAAGWVCPAAYFGTADGELLRARQRSNPGPVELSAAGPFAAFVERVRNEVAGVDLPDWRALPDDRARAVALLEWAEDAVAAAEAGAEEAQLFPAWYGRDAGPVRAVREVLRHGPPDLAVRALLFRADAAVAGWREDAFFRPMSPSPFAGPVAWEGTGSLLADGEVTARGTPPRRGAGTFGTAAGRAAALAALADPARTPAEVVLLVDLLTDWKLLFARESDGFSEIPAPSEPLTAARLPEHLALIAGVGRVLRHPDPAVRGFAADRLPNLLPPAERSARSRYREARSSGPWRLSGFAALQRLHDDLPPGVTRNAFAAELCGRLGLSWTDPTDRDANARLIGELTGSEAALLVTLPRTVTRAPAGAKTVEVRFDLHPEAGRGTKKVPPDERVTVRAAELTPPDGSAPLTVGVSGVTVEPSGQGWRATATLDLTDRLTRLNDPDGVAPGRWTVRLRGETVPDGGDDADDGGGLNWVSEPGVLAVE